MKRLLTAITAIIIAAAPAVFAAETDLLVDMPTPPKEITRLDERCNYIVINYWTTFNPKSSFSSLDRLNKTMAMFMNFTPYATADTVFLAIDRLTQLVSKASPENLITLASMAEKHCYTDTCEIFSEDLYYPFVKAIATNKKAKGPLRDRFIAQYKRIENSRIGSKVENLEYILADGTKSNLDSISTEHILMLFYDPECTDCRLAKARLAADFTLNALVRNKTLSIIALYPDEPDDAWREDAADMPKGWIVAALPDADTMFSIQHQPEIYYLDGEHTIKVKGVSVDNILNTFSQFLRK